MAAPTVTTLTIQCSRVTTSSMAALVKCDSCVNMDVAISARTMKYVKYDGYIQCVDGSCEPYVQLVSVCASDQQDT